MHAFATSVTAVSKPNVWSVPRRRCRSSWGRRRRARSSINFLWTTFTRFDPGADIHAARVELLGTHPAFTPPILIDARSKSGYPAELFCDEATAKLVGRRWTDYFPDGGVEMGDSDRAHLD
jgi:hypothetical protein